MGQIVRRALLLGAALLGVAGCQGSGSRPPADPLFVSRKPIELKAAYSPLSRSVQLEQQSQPAVETALTAGSPVGRPAEIVVAAH